MVDNIKNIVLSIDNQMITIKDLISSHNELKFLKANMRKSQQKYFNSKKGIIAKKRATIKQAKERGIKTKCICGKVVSKYWLYQHKKTEYHKKRMRKNSLNIKD